MKPLLLLLCCGPLFGQTIVLHEPEVDGRHVSIPFSTNNRETHDEMVFSLATDPAINDVISSIVLTSGNVVTFNFLDDGVYFVGGLIRRAGLNHSFSNIVRFQIVTDTTGDFRLALIGAEPVAEPTFQLVWTAIPDVSLYFLESSRSFNFTNPTTRQYASNTVSATLNTPSGEGTLYYRLSARLAGGQIVTDPAIVDVPYRRVERFEYVIGGIPKDPAFTVYLTALDMVDDPVIELKFLLSLPFGVIQPLVIEIHGSDLPYRISDHPEFLGVVLVASSEQRLVLALQIFDGFGNVTTDQVQPYLAYQHVAIAGMVEKEGRDSDQIGALVLANPNELPDVVTARFFLRGGAHGGTVQIERGFPISGLSKRVIRLGNEIPAFATLFNDRIGWSAVFSSNYGVDVRVWSFILTDGIHVPNVLTPVPVDIDTVFN